MPNAFLVPLSKTAAWWAKDWMDRHTYFLPRYEAGRMVNEGHALASAAGIACLMRRTYKHEREPAPAGRYDFVTYFECTDADVPTFHDVCAALRDVKRNPEWEFVQGGADLARAARGDVGGTVRMSQEDGETHMKTGLVIILSVMAMTGAARAQQA